MLFPTSRAVPPLLNPRADCNAAAPCASAACAPADVAAVASSCAGLGASEAHGTSTRNDGGAGMTEHDGGTSDDTTHTGGRSDEERAVITGSKGAAQCHAPTPNGRHVRVSKAMTAVLRHRALDYGMHVRPDGFVYVDELLRLRLFRGVTPEHIEHVVRMCPKQRFALAKDPQTGRQMVRANQGHSLKGVIDDEALLRPVLSAEEVPMCVHGTSLRSWNHVRESGGMCRMNRNHIHFATSLPGPHSTAISGARADAEAFIHLDVKAALAGGIKLYMSANGVVLSPGLGERGVIPMQYIRCVVDAAGHKLWEPPKSGRGSAAAAAAMADGGASSVTCDGERPAAGAEERQ